MKSNKIVSCYKNCIGRKFALNSQVKVTTEEKKIKRFITLPYINDQVEKFSSLLSRLVNANLPKVFLKVAFKAPKEIDNCFYFKDRPTDVLKQSL